MKRAAATAESLEARMHYNHNPSHVHLHSTYCGNVYLMGHILHLRYSLLANFHYVICFCQDAQTFLFLFCLENTRLVNDLVKIEEVLQCFLFPLLCACFVYLQLEGKIQKELSTLKSEIEKMSEV